MPVEKLRRFLDREKVRYELLAHQQAFTAPEVAASTHVKGREMVKVVVVDADGEMALAVLPSTAHVDLAKLRQVTGARRVSLAAEDRFADVFPGCERGAMPPFGNLYGLDVYVDPALTHLEDIVFNAGSHTEAIRMKFTDFERLVEPRIGAFAS